MSYISVKGEQSSQDEIDLLSALDSLPVSPAGEFIRKTGITSFANEAPGGAPGSGITRSIVVTSGNATMGATSDIDYVYLVAGAHTLTLPSAVGNTNRYTIKNNHNADITINTTSSQTIDGALSVQISPEDSVEIMSNNSNWNIA
jgi:hypothetical protein